MSVLGVEQVAGDGVAERVFFFSDSVEKKSEQLKGKKEQPRRHAALSPPPPPPAKERLAPRLRLSDAFRRLETEGSGYSTKFPHAAPTFLLPSSPTKSKKLKNRPPKKLTQRAKR